MLYKIINNIHYKFDVFKKGHKILAELKKFVLEDSNIKVVFYFKTKFYSSQHFYITELESEGLLFNEYETVLLYKIKGAYEFSLNTNELPKIIPFLNKMNQDIINGR